MSRAPHTTEMLCSCGGRIQWECRETYRDRRWLGLCSDPQCGQVRIKPVDGEGPPDGLEFFLLDGPPIPYTPPWIRLFLHASQLVRWRPVDRCWDCAGNLSFKMTLPPDPDRPGDPYEVVLCIECGGTEIAFWIPPRLNRARTPGSAWDEAILIQTLRRALRDRIADHQSSACDD
jgi:hypothetical protein